MSQPPTSPTLRTHLRYPFGTTKVTPSPTFRIFVGVGHAKAKFSILMEWPPQVGVLNHYHPRKIKHRITADFYDDSAEFKINSICIPFDCRELRKLNHNRKWLL